MAADLKNFDTGAPEGRAVSEATLRRLPLYHRFVKELAQIGNLVVSCTQIGAALDLDSTQVRKDIEATGIVGRPRVGYGVPDLIAAIERFLGWDNATDAFLVGAGHLGAALLGYRRFEECGLKIIAAFDTDARKAGTEIHGKKILPLDKLPDLMERMKIRIAIIAVPAAAAQGVADLLVDGGVRAVWNFAPVRLALPQDVIVHNEDLYCSLAALSQKLKLAMQAEVRRQQQQQQDG